MALGPVGLSTSGLGRAHNCLPLAIVGLPQQSVLQSSQFPCFSRQGKCVPLVHRPAALQVVSVMAVINSDGTFPWSCVYKNRCLLGMAVEILCNRGQFLR